ncbi:hypothetical protein EXIGLDRAFT_722806 [Exidia glandulosa HHB12029]|nr:hypothetical protein EXIGLDRAFT_722806 [Exidia glandulosa HHB12029]
MSRTFNPLDDGYVIKGHSSSGAVDVLTEVQPCHPSERVVLDSKPVTPKCRNLQSLVISYTQRSRELFSLPLLEQLKWAALGKCDANRPGMIAFIGPLPTRDPEVLADCDESGAVFHDTGVRDEDDDYDDMTS